MKKFRFLFCVLAGFILSTLSARANVYATDIKLNGGLTNAVAFVKVPATISYHLNQAATMGVTVNVWQGTNVVATLPGGTNMGLNAVSWTPTVTGNYSLSITAAAAGFVTWTQISVDTNAGNYAFSPNGMAVNNNTNSPYYGRVLVGCSDSDGVSANPVTKAIILDGIYKMNADGSFADEGGFGYGGYTEDDGGATSQGQMPSFSTFVPWRLRTGDDDRVYMLDFSDEGAIVAFDMEVTTNQIVIDDGGYDGGIHGGPHNYAGNPDINDLAVGIGNFDVTATTTSDAAVWLCDFDSPPNWGIWMYHLVNGQSDTNDAGTQVVTTGGDLSVTSGGGCMIDTSLDIFCGQNLNAETAAYDVMEFTHWNSGVLPPASSRFTNALGTHAGQVAWGYGCGVDTQCATDPTFEAVQDVVLNSRTSPTIVACPMGAGIDDTNGSGIRLLNSTDGSIIETNLDFGEVYTCAAWDHVGNLYGASTSRNVWRAWSPPGASTNTTVAVAQVTVMGASAIEITSIAAVPTTAGCANVTINFTAPGNPAASAFTVVGASKLNGTYATVTSAVITGGSGAYQATFSNCSTEFFKIEQAGQ
jgi:hypothetical protein